MNVLMLRRGYKVEGDPQQRTLPSIHHKDDKCWRIVRKCVIDILILKLHPGERAQPEDLQYPRDQGAGQELDQEGQRHEQLSSKVGHLIRQ